MIYNFYKREKESHFLSLPQTMNTLPYLYIRGERGQKHNGFSSQHSQNPTASRLVQTPHFLFNLKERGGKPCGPPTSIPHSLLCEEDDCAVDQLASPTLCYISERGGRPTIIQILILSASGTLYLFLHITHPQRHSLPYLRNTTYQNALISI